MTRDGKTQRCRRKNRDKHLLPGLKRSKLDLDANTVGQGQLGADTAFAANEPALELELVGDAVSVRLADVVAALVVPLAKSRGSSRDGDGDESGGTHFTGCSYAWVLVMTVGVSCVCCCSEAGGKEWGWKAMVCLNLWLWKDWNCQSQAGAVEI